VARLVLSLLVLGAQALATVTGPSHNDAESQFKRGFDLFRLEAYPQALAFFEKAIDKNPRYAEAYFQSGWCYSRLGRYQEAVNAYSKAIALQPDYFEAHNSLCWTYGKLSRWTEAVSTCSEALAMRPSLEAFNNLGRALASWDSGPKRLKSLAGPSPFGLISPRPSTTWAKPMPVWTATRSP